MKNEQDMQIYNGFFEMVINSFEDCANTDKSLKLNNN